MKTRYQTSNTEGRVCVNENKENQTIYMKICSLLDTIRRQSEHYCEHYYRRGAALYKHTPHAIYKEGAAFIPPGIAFVWVPEWGSV